jgi:hypothetical protein
MAEKTPKSEKPEETTPEAMATAKAVPGAGETFVIRPSAELFDQVGAVPVALKRSQTQPTEDQPLWVAIRNRTQATGFDAYSDFVDKVLCEPENTDFHTEPVEESGVGSANFARQYRELRSQYHGVGAYNLLKLATEAFLLLNCGVRITDKAFRNSKVSLFNADSESNRLGYPVTLNENSNPAEGDTIPVSDIVGRLQAYLGDDKLPYIKRIVEAVFRDLDPTDRVYCYGVLNPWLKGPCLQELIWSYWHEESMLVQSINAVSLRFQNRRNGTDRDPLAHLEIDPIRPLSNLLWGYIQDEQHRLTVQRRAYEYDHHYGLRLVGKAVPTLKAVDSRSKFIEAFHNLLHTTSSFYTEDDDTTRLADAFPVLNALKETHLLLAQGAHNQFGDLPWTARVEMLIQEWLLARPEMRDFLQSRSMVPYREGWMAQVDTMKKLQGWSDVTVTHFRDLGVYGEQLLLSVRYGDWIGVNEPAQAANWARYWRPEVQSYIHAYRAVTGVDLTTDVVDTTMPSMLLRNRLAAQARTR